jgi:O-antigen/teichoic acid export membrane protein
LLRISGTLIADAFKRNDPDYISDIYRKSCLNQFIIGAFLFGGIWVNIDSILQILGPEYESGKWVIFFIGTGYLVDMLTGANAHIIAYSKHFRVVLYFILILIFQVVATMLILVPVWGIVGGAIAISFSFIINNLMRFIFLYRKYGFQPFTIKFTLVLISFFPAYFAGYFFPQLPLFTDLIARSAVFAIIYSILITVFKTSEDVNNTLINIYKQVKTSIFK